MEQAFVVKMLGEGQFGEVQLMTLQQPDGDRRLVAVKTLRRSVS